MIFALTSDLIFPDPALAEEDGLLAMGGDLREERLVLAYQNGIFPWFNADDPIMWFSPHERCVIFPGKIVVSRSMASVLRSGKFKVTMNQAFDQVIACCAAIKRKGQDGTWIGTAMQKAYIGLHRSGIAKSVEVWDGDRLIGGLYGVVVNDVFCGESMFSLVSNASKTALIWLCRNGGFSMIDCQLPNEHLLSLGAEMISREEYMNVVRFSPGA